MTASVATLDGTNKKFIPKRRAPYLLQNEVINRNINTPLDSINDPYQTLDNERPSKQRDDVSIKSVISKVSENKLVSKSISCSKNRVDAKLDYYEVASKLCGIQKRIVEYFVGCCMVRGEPITGPITIETLSSVTNTTRKTLKKVVQRIIQKGIMERIGGKTGKSGFSVFRFDKAFVNAFKLQLDLTSSQSFKNTLSLVQKNEATKMSLCESHFLPKEWEDIDCRDLEEIGFGLPQIRQIYSKGTNTADTIQTSIDHFSFALQNKSGTLDKYKNKLGTFMSVLQKGGAWVENDYMSPNEIALKKLSIQRKDRLERLKKLEEEFFSNAFELWLSGLTESQKNEIIPDHIKQAPFAKDIQRTIALKKYFKENIWQSNMPDELKKIKEEINLI
ncbi:hypothetical protein ACRRVB_00935 [Candidatus Cardinium hertigii]|uniref:hypothetical protein n=1 Tax=Candidatus Cardinium hertigii TaxID=247481 RepID=UPI003D7F123E